VTFFFIFLTLEFIDARLADDIKLIMQYKSWRNQSSLAYSGMLHCFPHTLPNPPLSPLN
jgi:hypothetical protein